MKWRVEQIVNGTTIDSSTIFESYEDAEKYLNSFIKIKDMVDGRSFDKPQLRIVRADSDISDSQVAMLTFGTIFLGMGLAYLIGKECAFRIATKNATANLNAVLAQMPAESAKEFVRAFKILGGEYGI